MLESIVSVLRSDWSSLSGWAPVSVNARKINHAPKIQMKVNSHFYNSASLVCPCSLTKTWCNAEFEELRTSRTPTNIAREG